MINLENIDENQIIEQRDRKAKSLPIKKLRRR